MKWRVERSWRMHPVLHFALAAICFGAVLAGQFAVIPSRRYDPAGLAGVVITLGTAALFCCSGVREYIARRSRSRARGLCTRCGYDLRATPRPLP